MTSCGVPIQVPFAGGMELRDPRQGDVGNYPGVGGVEAFCGGGGAPVRDLDGSQKPGILHDGQETQLETSSVVPFPSPIQLCYAPPPWHEYG